MVGQQGIYFLLLSPRFIKECRSVAKECSVVSEEKPTDPNRHIIYAMTELIFITFNVIVNALAYTK